MRNKFLGYYKPTKEELAAMWNECIFVFDTSTLLNIYRYTPETREDFFKILDQLKDRIWIPYQVGLEYHDQRENVISQQQIIYADPDEINKIFQEKILNKYQKGHPFANIEQIKRVIHNAVEQSKKILRDAEAKNPSLTEEDIHLDRITKLFEGKVGDPYPKDQVKKIYEEGQQRYSEKIPPGYEDEKKKAYPFGDLILWFQLIDHAKSQKKPIIFTIDDSKEDWWRRDKDRKERILGPRPELIQEIHAKADVPFYMYLADEFIRRAQTFLKVKIRPGTIKEVKETREQHEKDSKIDRQRLYERFLNELQYIQRHLDRLQAESMYIEAQRQLAENQFPDERDQLEHRYVQLQRELHSLQRREPELRARLADLQRQRREELATLRMQEEQTPTDN